MKIHDTQLAVADGTGSCFFGLNGACINEGHFREATLPEQVKADVDSLRRGLEKAMIVAFSKEAGLRIATNLETLLADCTDLERRLNELELHEEGSAEERRADDEYFRSGTRYPGQ